MGGILLIGERHARRLLGGASGEGRSILGDRNAACLLREN